MNTPLRTTLACGLLGFAPSASAADPVAVDDSYQVAQDAELSVTAPGVLANDTDADGDSLTAILTSSPVNGFLGLQSDGAFSYTPQAGFYGTDSFSYQAHDGATVSNDAIVTITVTQYGTGNDSNSYSGGSYGAMSPWQLALLALAAFYPRGLKPPKRRAISP
jgi:hypothetical protein